MYASIHIHTYIHAYIHTYIHTYTHRENHALGEIVDDVFVSSSGLGVKLELKALEASR